MPELDNFPSRPLLGNSMTKKMGTFDHGNLQLGKDEIRIFELLPAAEHSDPVAARIFKAPLRSAPSFSALSYCWGDQGSRVEIAIGSDTLSITASLEVALRALRDKDRSMLLWIDQICINQQDKKEKNRQLPLMEDIYSLSTETVGWFGQSTNESNVAMDYLQGVGDRALEMGLARLKEKALRDILSDEDDLNSDMAAETRRGVIDLISSQGDLLAHPARQGMMQLSMLPYFTRGWIQQEIAIPPKLRFQWGSKSIDVDTFAAGVWFQSIWILKSISSLMTPAVYSQPSTMALLGTMADCNAGLTYNIIPSLTTRGRFQLPEARHKLTMADLLQRLRIVQFTEPQDRVYGILGMALSRRAQKLVVDNTKRWEDVFADATEYIIANADKTSNTRGDGINFLSFARSPKNNGRSLPSWVPNLADLGSYSTLATATSALSPSYHAGGDFLPQQRLSFSDSKVLGCHGIIIDRIIEVGPVWEGDPTNHARDHSAGLAPLSAMAEFATKSKSIVTSNPDSKHSFRNDPERLLEAEWRVPVLNCESVSRLTSKGVMHLATTRSKSGYEMVKYTMLLDLQARDFDKIFSNIPLSPEEVAEVEEDCRSADAEERKGAEISFKLKKSIRYRTTTEYMTYCTLLDSFQEKRSFLGAEGFVGVGPLGMQVGDLVCVLYGASFPFMLREKEGVSGRYELVGEAYCDGIMKEEALKMGLEDVEFLLD